MPYNDFVYNPCDLSDWIKRIDSRSLALPTFQRGYVWDSPRVKSMLEALLLGRPVGILLLIPNNRKMFGSRPIGYDDDTSNPADLVLDGQQRLTSLWRALHGDPPLFVEVNEWSEKCSFVGLRTPKEIEVYTRSQPEPELLYKKKCFPFQILGLDGVTLNEDGCWTWCNEAVGNKGDEGRKLTRIINNNFGEPFRKRQIWYLKLEGMKREEYIDVYMKSNQSAAVIKKFDIAVALYDSDNNASLRQEIIDMVEDLTEKEHLCRRFFDIDTDDDQYIPMLGELMLKVACIMCGVVPTEANYIKKDVLDSLRRNKDYFSKALEWSLNLYIQEGIPSSKFVPSEVPLRVLPALYGEYTSLSEKLQIKADRLLRAYIWRSFLTERYSGGANTRLYDDYVKLCQILDSKNLSKIDLDDLTHIVEEGDEQDEAPVITDENLPDIFNSIRYPLPKHGALSDLKTDPLRRPKLKGTLSRAIFAITLRDALDFSSGSKITAGDKFIDCEYHHLFPKDYLREHNIAEKAYNHCLNFALVTKQTNGLISSQPPSEYLASGSTLHENAGGGLRKSVESHRIPFELLSRQPRAGKGSSKKSPVESLYSDFISERSSIIEEAMKNLAQGKIPDD